MTIKQGQNANADDIIIQAVAGEVLSTKDAVYIKTSDSKAYKTDADDVATLGFAGFVINAGTTGDTINIRHDGNMNGFSGLTTNSIYYLSSTAGEITETAPTNFKEVGRAISATVIKINTNPTKRMRVYTLSSLAGGSGTRYDITNPAGTTFRYTWDGTGDDPGINSGTVPIGTYLNIQAGNFNAANKGAFLVTGVGTDYFEVINASGVVESDKTLGSGYIDFGAVWTKPGGLYSVEVELVGGGGGGAGAGADDGEAAGGGGGYSKKIIRASALNSTENILIGRGGLADGYGGNSSSFGSHLSATGGSTASGNTPGSGGVGSGGDLNIKGQGGGSGETVNGTTGGTGGNSQLGGGGKPGDPAEAGGSYGGGGGGGQNPGSGSANGGAGAPGVVIVTEYY